MSARAGILLATLTLCLFGASALQPAQRFALLQTGSFHGMDVPLAQPSEWLGVYCEKTQCSARAEQIHTRAEHDDVSGEPTGAKTATHVFLSHKVLQPPLFLVRGVSMDARTVPTDFQGSQPLEAGQQLLVQHGAQKVLLFTTGKATDEAPLPSGSQLILQIGEERQVLFTVPKTANEAYVEVFWVGDLDGDGKPDFLLNTSEHYNVESKSLWLSSLAKKGKLVGLAATLRTTGC